MKLTLTIDLAHAAAWDAGNRSMRKAGRTVWSVDDYNASVDEFNRLLPTVEAYMAAVAAKHTERALQGGKG